MQAMPHQSSLHHSPVRQFHFPPNKTLPATLHLLAKSQGQIKKETHKKEKEEVPRPTYKLQMTLKIISKKTIRKIENEEVTDLRRQFSLVNIKESRGSCYYSKSMNNWTIGNISPTDII